MSLDLNELRAANKARLPQFKNKHGELAHSKADGSDWSPAQWFQALVGEVGEYAEQRLLYERGVISHVELAKTASKELADVQCYLDLNAARALDVVAPSVYGDAAQRLLVVMANLGAYANSRKKLDRGDLTAAEFGVTAQRYLEIAASAIAGLLHATPTTPVTDAHPTGIDLAQATRDKFNEVSRRVGCEVTL